MPVGACKGLASRASAALGLTLIAAAALCGCTQPLLVFRGAEKAATAEEPVATGSIERRPANFGDDLDEEDWRRACAALGVALDPQGNGRPVKWDNPESGLRGTISPTGLPYVADDLICRAFLASVIGPGGGRFVRGTGCKPSGGAWSLRHVRNAAAPARP